MEAALWRPASTCTTACLPRPGAEPRARPTTVAGRVVATAAVLLFAAVVLPMLPAGRVPGTARRIARALLAALGVRHEVTGRLATRRALVVANHVSWLDVVVLAAHLPARPLAKSEVRLWPVVGRLAVAMGTVFIDRSRPRSLPATVDAVAGALRGGGAVVAFPEGTTWCGRAGGPLRPALFQAALRAGAVVAPVRLTFALADGSPTTVAAFIGDESLLTSLRRVLTARGLAVTLRAHPPIHPGLGATRRGLAGVTQTVLRSGSPTVHMTGTSDSVQPSVSPPRQM
jgi:1-acyl-sn-glycerol-3-phosphate acyltransferase